MNFQKNLKKHRKLSLTSRCW